MSRSPELNVSHFLFVAQQTIRELFDMNEGEKREMAVELSVPQPEEEEAVNKQSTTILEQVRLIVPVATEKKVVIYQNWVCNQHILWVFDSINWVQVKQIKQLFQSVTQITWPSWNDSFRLCVVPRMRRT